MTLVPLYWYVEPGSDGSAFELIPWSADRPFPFGRDGLTILSDPVTGEVHREAILMCALPWPRFRGAGGEQVVLPDWEAQTLERLKDVAIGADGEYECPTCRLKKGGHRQHHFRVQIIDAERVSIRCTVHCHCGYSSSAVVSAHHARHLRDQQRIQGKSGVPVKGEERSVPLRGAFPCDHCDLSWRCLSQGRCRRCIVDAAKPLT